MTIAELNTILKQSNLPVVYHSFKACKRKPQQPPYIVYYISGVNTLSADNKVYSKNNHFRIELYTPKKDIQTEEKLEQILDENIIYYTKSETYINEEELFLIIYEI